MCKICYIVGYSGSKDTEEQLSKTTTSTGTTLTVDYNF